MMGRVKVPSSSRLLLSVLCLAAFGLGGVRSWATNFTVSDTSDNVADTNSLRYALRNLATGTAQDTNVITITATGTITLTGTLPTIAQGVTITGPGANLLTINGNGNQIMTVDNSTASPTVSISGLTFTNGKASTYGGAIDLSSGTLMVSNSVFSGNSSAG